MPPKEYYVHNLSPFIFTVDKLNLSWLATWYGISGVVVIAAVLLFLSIFKTKKLLEKNVDPGAWSMLTMLTVFSTLGLAALYLMQKWHVEWGLRWYSTMYLIAFIFVYMMCRRWIKQRRIMLTPVLLDSLIAYTILGMVIGARLAYVFIYNWDDYSKNLIEAVRVWEGGLSFHGGVVGVTTAIWIFCKRHKIPFWHIADKLSFCIPFGIGIGRIGNFINGELYGRIIESTVPWAVVFPDGGPQPRHPSQLYQSLGEGWLLFLTLFLISRKKPREGTIAIAFVFFYALFRIVMENYREADPQLRYYFGNTTTMGQILCGIFMLVVACLLFVIQKNPVEDSEPWRRRLEDFLEKRKSIEGN